MFDWENDYENIYDHPFMLEKKKEFSNSQNMFETTKYSLNV